MKLKPLRRLPRHVAAYLNVDFQVEPSLIHYNHSHNGLNHQGDEGVDPKHQGIAFHTEINCNLKPIVECQINIEVLLHIGIV